MFNNPFRPYKHGEEEPELGDMIEISRGTYQHWALYVGNNCVVHLTRPGKSSELNTNRYFCRDMAVVLMDKLQEVVGDNYYRVNNLLDRSYKPRPVRDIVKEALAEVGKVLRYYILSANCEHFVTKLRYGSAMSRQVQRLFFMGPVGWVTAGILALTGASTSSTPRSNKAIRHR
uniref:phospholipase A and acyltransferase 4-like n=1 Tax=Doryrhamphus excisus TaxID=161450 RepID=UPI0025ADE764|nr:phospholipase A and acyltransferase 4-like [Doryrhamphus excisus]XP_057941966.1 phospholipase A and acyltransferase 4-like [Doryrhamphus excisus]XP_057941967.1 phospholipase A and acyltransferase 4-like [Doryrhamphus excisus]